ncbi:MAG TPA: glycoside hydrolase family 13 protein [Candidatus Limnocylindrales bacterium]|nr:glycoside hydrolase family 13 protein [Candidatus Limnocylindrales bacterium]
MPIDTPDWVRDAVFYQVFPDRFARSGRVPAPGPLEPWDSPPTTYGFKGGDLPGIVDRLPYLAELGVNALYLTPVFASASNHRYHAYDYLNVDPLLGGNAGLRELLDAAHARGMRVVLDGVFNHTGRGFWPFHHVLETGASSPYRHWFHFDQAALDAGRPVLAYPGAERRGGSGSVAASPSGPGDGSGSLERLGYRAWWDLPALPKLNTSDPAAREYLLGVAEHWIRFGADGWRLDVPEEIADESFWQEFRTRVRALNPQAYLVGEIWRVAPEWLRGDRFDALMNYPLAEAVLSYAGAGHFDEALLRSHHEYGPNVHALDGPAFASRLREIDSAYDRAVTEAQLNLLDSHDSPRFHSLVGGDRAAYRMAMLLLATLPGAPCIYYGDEIGLAGGLDPDCRRSFPTDEAQWDGELLEFIRAVLALRHREPALRRGSFAIVGAAGGAAAYERRLDDARFVAAFNNSPQETRLRIQLADAARCGLYPVDGFGSGASPTVADDGSVDVDIAARSGSLLRVA